MSRIDDETTTEERLSQLPEPGTEHAFVAGRWGLDAVLFVAAAVLLSVPILKQLLGIPDGDLWQLVPLQIPAFLLGFVLGLLVVRYIDKRGLYAIGLDAPVATRFLHGVLWYLPLGGIWWLVSLTYSQVLQYFDVQLQPARLEQAFARDALEGWPLLLVVFAISVGAPLGEEMVFRGLLHGWLRRFLRFAPAALIGGVLFGLMHAELVKVVPMIVLGVMLAWLRERPPGLWGCIGFHAAHNALTLLLLTFGFGK